MKKEDKWVIFFYFIHLIFDIAVVLCFHNCKPGERDLRRKMEWLKTRRCRRKDRSESTSVSILRFPKNIYAFQLKTMHLLLLIKNIWFSKIHIFFRQLYTPFDHYIIRNKFFTKNKNLILCFQVEMSFQIYSMLYDFVVELEC